MKRNILKTLALLLCIPVLFALASCSQKHPIDDFREKMTNANSYQMSVTMTNVPLFGTFTMTTKVDGNIQYTPAVLFNEEQYTETVDGEKYIYTKNDDGKWEKSKANAEEENSDVTSDESMSEFFNANNYEKDKEKENTYKQKKDVTFENFKDVVMTIEENSCTIEMVSTDQGYGIKLVISNMGEVDLKLPEVK